MLKYLILLAIEFRLLALRNFKFVDCDQITNV